MGRPTKVTAILPIESIVAREPENKSWFKTTYTPLATATKGITG